MVINLILLLKSLSIIYPFLSIEWMEIKFIFHSYFKELFDRVFNYHGIPSINFLHVIKNVPLFNKKLRYLQLEKRPNQFQNDYFSSVQIKSSIENPGEERLSTLRTSRLLSEDLTLNEDELKLLKKFDLKRRKNKQKLGNLII